MRYILMHVYGKKNQLQYFQVQLRGYSFPVYSTRKCPKNETEWNRKSSALNCSQLNGYMCLPNQQLTELLEFCYRERKIRIQEGKYHSYQNV